MQHPQNVLDMNVIESLRELGGDDDPGLLTELIDLFLMDAPTHLAALEQAMQAGDGEAMERAAHTLKSSSANIGAVQLSEFCRELEMAGKTSALDGSQSVVEATQQHYAEVCQALESLRS